MRHLKHQKKTHALLAAEGHRVEKFREYRLNDIGKAVSKKIIILQKSRHRQTGSRDSFSQL